ncbi:hypothetical protein MBLNU459_g4275t2 [Dothideomycetes sp. NU459]
MQRDFCSPGGYLEQQGYDISATRAIIPGLQRLLHACRKSGFQVYHTREGKANITPAIQRIGTDKDKKPLPQPPLCKPNLCEKEKKKKKKTSAALSSHTYRHANLGHRPDLSTLSSRELARSRNNPSHLGIGDLGPLGRLLVRGEAGHDTIAELYPAADGSEPVVDKPGRGAFAHTDFELLLRLRGIRNLVVTGVTADVCVHSTMREANDRGFDCVLVEDGTAASEEALRVAAVEMVRTEGGIFGATCLLEHILAAVETFSKGPASSSSSSAPS